MSATDTWTMQDVLDTTAYDESSTLTFLHSGSPVAGIVQVPALSIGANDVLFSRISAGNIALGTGTPGNTQGTLNLSSINIQNSLTWSGNTPNVVDMIVTPIFNLDQYGRPYTGTPPPFGNHGGGYPTVVFKGSASAPRTLALVQYTGQLGDIFSIEDASGNIMHAFAANGNVGIGINNNTTSPSAPAGLFSVGASSQFQVDASGNIQTTGNLSVTGTYKDSSGSVGTSGQFLKSTGTGTAWSAVSGSGTVTSFSAGNLSPLFTTSVATASTTPALSFLLSTQSANLVFAGPTTGAAAAPTFRSLVAADIPSLSYIGTSLMTTAGDIIYENATPTAARLAIGSAGQVLTVVSGLPAWVTPSSGFTNPMTTLGDIIYENATPAAARLAGNITTTKKYLSQTGNGTISAAPAWAQIAAADLSNGTTGTGAVVLAASPALTGSPTAPTQTAGDNTTKIATDQFVTAAIAAIVPIAPGLKTATVTLSAVQIESLVASPVAIVPGVAGHAYIALNAVAEYIFNTTPFAPGNQTWHVSTNSIDQFGPQPWSGFIDQAVNTCTVLNPVSPTPQFGSFPDNEPLQVTADNGVPVDTPPSLGDGSVKITVVYLDFIV